MNHTLPTQAREYVLFQRTELLPKRDPYGLFKRLLMRLKLADDGFEDFVRDYAAAEPVKIDAEYFDVMRVKAESLLPHIPPETSSILDIGCGIAALDLFLFERLEAPTLILLDKTSIETKVWYMFEQSGAFYNSLELAEETLTQNGVPGDKIQLLEATDNGDIKLPDRSVDLIVSTISWGFHYPVSTYVDSVARVMSERGALIIDVRDGTGGEDELREHFDLDVIDVAEKHKTFKCTLKPQSDA